MLDIERIALAAIDRWGIEHQKTKCIEEIGELLSEMSREQDSRTTKWLIAGEIADCMILLQQLRIIYGKSRIDSMLEIKANRLAERLGLTEEKELTEEVES